MSTKLYFITWPDGKLFEGTQTCVSADLAIGRALLTWLIPDYFKGLDLGARWHGPMRELWAAMERSGFKLHEIELDGIEGISL